MGIANISGNILTDSGTNLSSLVSGTGTTNFHAKFTGSTTLGNSLIYDDGTNVGIGTASPLSKLQVVGTGTVVRFGEASGTTGKQTLFGIDSATGRTEIQSVWQGTSSTPLAFNPAGGNVLIGTTTDNGNKLQVAGDVRLDNGAADGAQLVLASSGFSDWNIDNFSGNFRWYYGATERMRITSSGNLGIGTTSPSALLTVAGRAQITGNAAPSSGTGLELFYDGTGAGTLAFARGTGYIPNFMDGSQLQFFTSSTERMRITSGGNVGIGTSSPQVRFEVSGLNGNIRIYGQSGLTQNGISSNVYYNGSSWVRDNSSYGAGAIRFDSDNSSIVFNTDATTSGFPAERMRITNSGYVLVGYTSAPSVAGLLQTTSAYVGILGTGVVYSLSGVLTSTNPSDLRLKDSVEDLGYGLKEILQLRPVKYNWKNDNANQGKQFGFIAQEVQEVMPELVTTFDTEDGERLGLEKEGIYAALVQAIKELSAKVTELENKLK